MGISVKIAAVEFKILILALLQVRQSNQEQKLDSNKTEIWGPGLRPDEVITPARYFFIQAVDTNGDKFRDSPGGVFSADIEGDSDVGSCRVWLQILDRHDGSFIVRYRPFHTCWNARIHVRLEEKDVAKSPYKVKGIIYPEECHCPVDFETWSRSYRCPESYTQINHDLKPFQKVDFDEVLREAKRRFSNFGSYAFCNYVVKDNKVYRRCYGQHVGFSMFMDNILLSLARKTHLPDTELLVNLGDWPLVNPHLKPLLPIFTWCGSDETADIVMPTYDITEATLECMGRVMLDMLSVQTHSEKQWKDKIEKGFWRGRDSRRERLNLIDIARKNPDLFNVSLTNFFFFRDEEEKYGPKQPHVSFFRFFDYKYQISLDGTVAAYRFPFLLAGDGVVFKQDSNYYEHFYKELQPWKHYIPFHRDLSNLVERIRWAKENDEKARQIGMTGRQFAQDSLMPTDVFCYHAVLLQEWSKRITSTVKVRQDMEEVPQQVEGKPYGRCKCHRKKKMEDKGRDEKDRKDEL